MSYSADVATNPNFDIAVIYNGVTETIQVNPEQPLQAVLQHALQAFGMPGNPNNLVLANADNPNAELPTNVKAGDAGVGAGTRLLLRPRATRGG